MTHRITYNTCVTRWTLFHMLRHTIQYHMWPTLWKYHAVFMTYICSYNLLTCVQEGYIHVSISKYTLRSCLSNFILIPSTSQLKWQFANGIISRQNIAVLALNVRIYLTSFSIVLSNNSTTLTLLSWSDMYS